MTNTSTALHQLKPGEEAIISGFDNCTAQNTLMELGVLSGASIRMIKSAPLGDPLEVQVRGCHLSIRRAEAQKIVVQKGK